jgi:hypothetical protein
VVAALAIGVVLAAVGVAVPAGTRLADGSGFSSGPEAAVNAPATRTGTAIAWFRQRDADPVPVTDPARQIAVALVHVDADGEVRWARRVWG